MLILKFYSPCLFNELLKKKKLLFTFIKIQTQVSFLASFEKKNESDVSQNKGEKLRLEFVVKKKRKKKKKQLAGFGNKMLCCVSSMLLEYTFVYLCIYKNFPLFILHLFLSSTIYHSVCLSVPLAIGKEFFFRNKFWIHERLPTLIRKNTTEWRVFIKRSCIFVSVFSCRYKLNLK